MFYHLSTSSCEEGKLFSDAGGVSFSTSTSASVVTASALSTTKHESRDIFSIPNDIQRLKNVRRHEPTHVSSGSGSQSNKNIFFSFIII